MQLIDKNNNLKKLYPMKRIIVISAAAVTAMTALAEVKLPHYLTDNMVVQQNAVLTIPATAKPGSTVKVTPGWSGETVTAKADKNGKFTVKLSTPAAGGPYEITFVDPDGEVTLDNVLSGEVWLCSGQSNMEFPIKGWLTEMDVDHIVATANNPDIRLLQVRKNTSFSPLDDIETNMGGWVQASSATMDFSAIAYLFARQLRDELKVPVGVIDATWGGTPAEAWTSYEGLKGVPGFESEMEAMKRCGFDGDKLQADYEKNMAEWMKLAGSTDLNFDKAKYQTGKEWGKMPAGQNFDLTVLPSSFDGVVWAQYKFNAPTGSAGRPFALDFCPIDDEDITYVNGAEVARGVGHATPRHYNVRAGVLKDGENIISIRISDFGGGGGFNGNAEDMYAMVEGQRIPLNGDWNYAVGADFTKLPAKPVSVGGSSYPTVLYNAMISPLQSMPVKGVLWYQGCANVGRDSQYAPLFKSLINDWRKLWGEDMPFYFVQLAGYLQPRNLQPDSEWAALRNAQAKALELYNTSMAVAIDLGNPVDIHPRNKQDVAARLARIALARDYGRDVAYAAPTVTSVKSKGNVIELTFNGEVVPTSAAVTGFIVGDGSGNFAVANGKLTSPVTIELTSPKIAKPTVVRYDWADYPGGNLYSRDRLPVAPFATDK